VYLVVGFMAKRTPLFAGRTSDPANSVPFARRSKPAENPTAEPVEDPHGFLNVFFSTAFFSFSTLEQ
jgi:hypothetical protein